MEKFRFIFVSDIQLCVTIWYIRRAFVQWAAVDHDEAIAENEKVESDRHREREGEERKTIRVKLFIKHLEQH